MFRNVQECSMFLILSTARRAKGRYTRGSLLPKHAPGAKLPCLHQRFLAKKYVAQQNFCSRVLLPHRSKLQAQICCTSLFQEQAPSCVLKFACRDTTCLQLANQIGLFFSSTTHCEPQSGCFIIQLSRRVLRVYCLGYGACFRSKLPRVYRPKLLSGKQNEQLFLIVEARISCFIK